MFRIFLQALDDVGKSCNFPGPELAFEWFAPNWTVSWSCVGRPELVAVCLALSYSSKDRCRASKTRTTRKPT